MRIVLLPVSGTAVCFRPPAGTEDLLLAEAPACDVSLALALASALGQAPDGSAVPWETLPISDLDAALLLIRQLTLGDLVHSSASCGVSGCRARIDVSFRISNYLAHHSPRQPRAVSRAEEPGWFRLDAAEALFRLPSSGDQLVISAPGCDAARELTRLCIRPANVTGRLRRRIEAAIEALAPSLYGELTGRCPECDALVGLPFDPQRYVLEELRAHARFICEEVHLLAAHYHWSERHILALPRTRRARYAELIHDAMRSAS